MAFLNANIDGEVLISKGQFSPQHGPQVISMINIVYSWNYKFLDTYVVWALIFWE